MVEKEKLIDLRHIEKKIKQFYNTETNYTRQIQVTLVDGSKIQTGERNDLSKEQIKKIRII